MARIHIPSNRIIRILNTLSWLVKFEEQVHIVKCYDRIANCTLLQRQIHATPDKLAIIESILE